MKIFRKNIIPSCYSKIPFVREGICGFSDCPEDQALIKLFKDCAAGRTCISKLDTNNRIVVKVEVPDDIITGEEYTYALAKWTIYYWASQDVVKATRPNGREPYEAVSLKSAGITEAYLDSISLKRCFDEAEDCRDMPHYL
jgi:hypothetical protein